MPPVTRPAALKDFARLLLRLGVQPDADRSAIESTLKAQASTSSLAALQGLSAFDAGALKRAIGDESARLPMSTLPATVRTIMGGAGKLRADVERQLPATTAKLYEVEGKIGRPLERVLTHVARLHEGLSGVKDVHALIDRMLQQDTRKHLFMLQGLLRIYADHAAGGKLEKRLDKALERTKELEDALGAYGYALDMHKGVSGKDVPQAALALLRDNVEKSKTALQEILEDGWRPGDGKSRRLQKLVDTFSDLPLGDVRGDAAFLQQALAQLVGKIANKQLDMTDLEGGLHELRRQLRWIPIIFVALDGHVRIDEHAPSRFDALKKDPVAQSPFAKLPTSQRETTTIDVPQGIFLALSKHIGELGKIKDRGQLIVGLAHALQESDAFKKKKCAGEAERMLKMSLDDVFKDATALHKTLTSSGLLLDLQKALRG